jgi:hypothetical protein
MSKRAQAGFTLVEIVVVVAILGILSAVVVISVAGIPDRGQRSACSSDRQALVSAYETASANRMDLSTPSTDVSDALVAAGLLHSASTYYRISNAGEVTVRPGTTKCS